MTFLIIALLVIYFISNTFVYRFQRTTLSISRSLISYGDPNMQALLTPDWIGLLGWINTGLWIILCVLLFIQFGWISVIFFLLYVFVGTAFMDFITPLPSYNQCFKIIEKSLNKDIQTTSDPAKKEALLSLSGKIIKIKEQYKIETK